MTSGEPISNEDRQEAIRYISEAADKPMHWQANLEIKFSPEKP